MADYTTTAIIQPEIPQHLISEAEEEILIGMGFEIFDDPSRKTKYLAAYQYTAYTEYEGEEFEEDQLIELLQAMVKSSDLQYITMESTYRCSKLRPDGFGAFVMLITKNRVDYLSTFQWIEEKLNDYQIEA